MKGTREDLRLRTVRRASEETGASISFLKKLLADKSLTRYKIKTAVYISLTEFEEVASRAIVGHD